MIIKGYFCLFLHKNICCGYSLESPHMFFWRTDENYHQIPSLSGVTVYRNGPERTKTDRNRLSKIPKQTSRSTETGLNKGGVGQGWAGTDFVPTYLPTYLPRVRIPLYLPSSCLLCTYLPTHIASSNQSTI